MHKPRVASFFRSSLAVIQARFFVLNDLGNLNENKEFIRNE